MSHDLFVEIRNSHTFKTIDPHLPLHYAKNILTVPRMNARQMGQFRKDGAQLLQQDKCPQGKNTTLTSSSMQTLQIFASFNCRFSSTRLLASVKAVITEKLGD